MIILIILLSFYLEGIVNSFINIDYLVPLFTMLSLIIVYPYLYNKKKLYIMICFITGLLYDIGYTDTLFLNATIFTLIGYIIMVLNKFITNNKFNVALISIILIILYRVITYIILNFINYVNKDINLLLNSIIDSILINIIYIVILYIITDIIANKKGIYKLD